uniref:Uncharacterized protein n=1 Tax=Phaseolus vulgaris TaxID=3885 RepID=V7BKU4_PHAVU|nr:hypothetical protein PHAVU_006G056000g [Phaseolus vulgaris]ESW18619.1 hypothetical protein PHAVU_006G056000g [Phaseolus vulgaris]
MGSAYSKHVGIELYKWSTSEFPQEYALVYTSLDDTSRTTTLRFSVNTDMVLCGVADHMCKYHPVRFHAKLTAIRDSNGDYRFGEVVVAQHGCEISTRKNNIPFFRYNCSESFPGNDVSLMPRMHMLDAYWDFSHSLEIGVRRNLRCYGRVECDKETGLMVGLSGPFLYKGFFIQDELGLEGQANMGAQATEKMFNMGAQFQGNGNGAKYQNCNIVMKYKAAAPKLPRGTKPSRS